MIPYWEPGIFYLTGLVIGFCAGGWFGVTVMRDEYEKKLKPPTKPKR